MMNFERICGRFFSPSSARMLKAAFTGGCVHGYRGLAPICKRCACCSENKIEKISEALKNTKEAFQNMAKGLEKEAEKKEVAYICDRRKCPSCSYPECMHTIDIAHAANFDNIGGLYIENARAGADALAAHEQAQAESGAG